MVEIVQKNTILVFRNDFWYVLAALFWQTIYIYIWKWRGSLARNRRNRRNRPKKYRSRSSKWFLFFLCSWGATPRVSLSPDMRAFSYFAQNNHFFRVTYKELASGVIPPVRVYAADSKNFLSSPGVHVQQILRCFWELSPTSWAAWISSEAFF